MAAGIGGVEWWGSTLGGAAAFLAAVAAQPAFAQSQTITVEAERDDAQPIYPSVGLMNDHMHDRGEFMVGLRFESDRFSGANLAGTRAVSDADLLVAGNMMRARSMTMDMAMVDLMYGATDNLTLTLSPQYVWNRMTMIGIDPMGGMNGSMAPGETQKSEVHGFGDTLASASFRLIRRAHLNAHLTLGIWIPTGAVDRLYSDGTFVEYCMQPGSGTWDIEPSAKVGGARGPIVWGAQASYRWRAERRNRSGYRLGDKALLTSWVSYLVQPHLNLTVRTAFTSQGRIHGSYNGPQSEGAPPDLPENYGGDLLEGAIGLNWQPKIGGMRGPQFGIEAAVPLYQRVNGVQLPEKWRVTAAVRHSF
ncbi:MAG TPA: hypothetical protein VFW19_12260 [Allosphingosinicella sp.]|nr:hypothetical protein [Allosphingosinicella sp.]